MHHQTFVRALAKCFLAGEQTPEKLVERGSHLVGKQPSWLPALARRYCKFLGNGIRPRIREVARFLSRDRALQRALQRGDNAVAHWLVISEQMQPVRSCSGWPLPRIETSAALSEWLGIVPGDLEWFADIRSLAFRSPNEHLRHYTYRVLAKDSSSIRLIEAPKSRIKELQRRILAGILEKIPVHVAAHGFCKGRSVQTFAGVHSGQDVVLRMDLRDFFPSISAARVKALFRTVGYPERVADLLGAICTSHTPRSIWNTADTGVNAAYFRDYAALYTRRHLPQGAPTSPALANLCFYRSDCRLSGLARAAGAAYARYADDLAFSGGILFTRRAERFSLHVAAILSEEGFATNHRKTRIMRRSVQQRLAGLVVNDHPNICRQDYDRLKAILVNCIRNGPESQNREAIAQFRAHLAGRLAYVASVSPARATKLYSFFEKISWPELSPNH
jgi:hypothetical protein